MQALECNYSGVKWLVPIEILIEAYDQAVAIEKVSDCLLVNGDEVYWRAKPAHLFNEQLSEDESAVASEAFNQDMLQKSSQSKLKLVVFQWDSTTYVWSVDHVGELVTLNHEDYVQFETANAQILQFTSAVYYHQKVDEYRFILNTRARSMAMAE